jgi:hypothetical protein
LACWQRAWCWIPLKKGRDYKTGKEKLLLLDRTGKRRLSAVGALLRSVTIDPMVAKTGRGFHTKRS